VSTSGHFPVGLLLYKDGILKSLPLLKRGPKGFNALRGRQVKFFKHCIRGALQDVERGVIFFKKEMGNEPNRAQVWKQPGSA